MCQQRVWTWKETRGSENKKQSEDKVIKDARNLLRLKMKMKKTRT